MLRKTDNIPWSWSICFCILVGVLSFWAQPTKAYFGGHPFDDCNFGIGQFGTGPFGEDSCSDEAAAGGFLLMTDYNYVLQTNSTANLKIILAD